MKKTEDKSSFFEFDDRVRRIRDIVIIDLLIAVASFFLGAFLNSHLEDLGDRNKVVGLLTQVVEYEQNAIENNAKWYDSYSVNLGAVLNDKVSVEMYQNIIKEDDVFMKVDSSIYANICHMLEFSKYLDDYTKLDTTSAEDKISAYKWRDETLVAVNKLTMLACEEMTTRISDDVLEQRVNSIIEEYAKNAVYQITIK